MATLGTVSSAVGLADVAIKGIVGITDYVKRFKNAPKEIETLGNYLETVRESVEDIRAISQSKWDAIPESAKIRAQTALRFCSDSCEQFGSSLREWTEHSQEGRFSWRDQTKIAFKTKKINEMTVRLRTSQLTINGVLTLATFSTLEQFISASDKENLQTKQQETESYADEVNKRERDVTGAIEEADVDTSSPLPDKVKTLVEERRALQALQQLLEEVRAKLEEASARPMQGPVPAEHTVITSHFGSHNSGMQIGYNSGKVNTGTISKKIGLNVPGTISGGTFSGNFCR